MYQFIRSFIDPVTSSFLLLAILLVWAWWKHPDARKGLRWLTAGFVLVWVALSEATGYWTAGMLEWRYPPVLELPADADVIVLLSSGAIPPTEFLPETTPGPATLRRCRRAARLYHTRPVPIIACGANLDPQRRGDSLAQVMQTALVEMGVEQDDVYLEENSTDTYQNVTEAKRLLDEHGWTDVVLVTDGTHLLRAELCFRRAGTKVVPASAHYESLKPPRRVADFLPSTGGANSANVVLHEVVGLIWYKLRGRI